MAAIYTFDVFSSLDGFGSASGGDWGAPGASRAPSYSTTASPCTRGARMVFGANTYRLFARMLATSPENPR